MKKVKFDTYNDGLFEYGDYIESYDNLGNACKEKEFIPNGKLFFSYEKIREQDKLKYDHTGLRVSIKLKTRYISNINTSNVIKLDGNLYSIAYIDPDNKRQNLYIYLTELINELDKHLFIYSKKVNGPMEDDTWELYKIVWSKIISSSYKSEKETVEANKLTPGIYKTATIRYLDILDLSINGSASIDFKVKYKDQFYNILQIVNVDELDEILELSLKGE